MAVFKRPNSSHDELIRFLLGEVEGKQDKEATNNNLNYFLNFNDPSIPEVKMGSAIHAIYDHVICEMIQNGNETTTPAQVWEYMREVAEKKPLALHLMNLVVFWELALLVRKCERKNNADAFFDSLPLFLPLFASTHGTEYIKICCDLIKFWATCSDLEKELIRKYGFTVQTGTGLSVGLDYCFEKYVNLIWSKTGKIYRRGQDTRAENAALTIIEENVSNDLKKRIDQSKQQSDRMKPTERLLTDDAQVYILVLLKLEERRIFAQVQEGEVDDVFASPRNIVFVLDSRLLALPSMGVTYGSEYFVHKYIDARKPKPDLSQIPSGMKKSEKQRQFLDILYTSTNQSEIEETTSITIKHIREQIALIRNLNQNVKSRSRLPTKRPALIEVEKKEYFKENEQAPEDFKKRVRETYTSGTSVESRKTLLANILLSFEGCTEKTSGVATHQYPLGTI